jgi:3-phosphoglycerate kinase
MSRYRTLDAIEVQGKTALVRVDHNVPLDDGKVRSDLRIRRSIPTIRSILDRGGKAVLLTHLGRPKGKPDPEFSVAPVARHLEHLMEHPVQFVPAVTGDDVRRAVDSLSAGEILYLENVRYEPGEQTNDPDLARTLASYADFYVNDAFGTCHRAHASVVGVTAHLPSVAGQLVRAELLYVKELLANPRSPFVAVIGGIKISDKIPLMRNLMSRVTTFLVGGGAAYSFLAESGLSVGGSPVEPDLVGVVSEIRAEAKQAGVEIVLPEDHLVIGVDGDKGRSWVVDESIPEDASAVDLGPRSAVRYAQAIERAAEVVLFGPMGVFEWGDPFSRGTEAVVRAMARCSGITVVGGGDSSRAVLAAGVESSIDHISTGGGAFLEILGTGILPGVEALVAAPTEI